MDFLAHTLSLWYNHVLKESGNFNFRLLGYSTFPCSSEQSFLGSLHGQERNAICEENRESGSMHPLSERDRAKKDYGKVE